MMVEIELTEQEAQEAMFSLALFKAKRKLDMTTDRILSNVISKIENGIKEIPNPRKK